jgi:hypothetical protein
MRVLLLSFLITACKTRKEGSTTNGKTEAGWAMLSFIKVDSLNPILQPSLKQTFYCPVSKNIVMWEGRNVLNPSAVVREGKIYLVYRAQDKRNDFRISILHC